MLRILAVVCLLATVQGNHNNSVTRSHCYKRSAWHGEPVSCEQGYVGVELCSSGKHADCYHHGRTYTVLTCCPVVGAKHHQNCLEERGSYGVRKYCKSNKAVTQVCTSGGLADCGWKTYTRINCCDGMGLSVSRRCVWSHGGYGKTVTCGHNSVIAGVCSSGGHADCGNYYTGIYCCQLNN